MPQGRERIGWAALLAVQLLLVRSFAFVCDDAWISFRYARNLARGDGLVFDPGERVEGYSNLLWVVLASVVEALSADPSTWMPLLSAACGVALVVGVAFVLRVRLGCSEPATFAAVAPLALSPVLSVWSTSGLETMGAALLVGALAEGLCFGRHRGAIAAFLLVLLRVDGWAWVCAVGLAVLVTDAGPPRDAARQVGLGLTALAPLVALRLAWFGELVPNVVLVKGATGPWVWLRGFRYVALTTMTCVTPALMALALPAAFRRGGAARAAAGLALVGPAWAVAVGGDFMPFGRLLVPSLPFLAVALGVALDRVAQDADRLRALGLTLAVVGIWPGLGVHLVPEALRAPIDVRGSEEAYLSEVDKWENMVDNTRSWLALGEALRGFAKPGDALVSGAVGAVGYASDLVVFDRFGLVTPEVARRPTAEGPLFTSPGHDKGVPAWFFADRRPRFLYARVVAGRLAAGRMKDSLDEWEVPDAPRRDWLPDVVELPPRDGERAFLLMVRRAEPGEDAAEAWSGFSERRRALNAELKVTEAPRR